LATVNPKMTSWARSGGHVLADPADHHRQLPLVVQLVAEGGPDHGLVVADHRGVRLQEDQRLGRHLVAQLGGVLGVVPPDADDLAAGNHRGHQPDLGQVVTGPGVLDRFGHWISGDDGNGVGVIPLISGQFNNSEGGIPTGGDESGDAHGPRISVLEYWPP
jgi:hypothetical protein